MLSASPQNTFEDFDCLDFLAAAIKRNTSGANESEWIQTLYLYGLKYKLFFKSKQGSFVPSLKICIIKKSNPGQGTEAGSQGLMTKDPKQAITKVYQGS